MMISEKGLDLIKRFEGLRLKSYKAVPYEKYYTIGYGHYGADVKKDDEITEAEANALLEEDVNRFSMYVEAYDYMYNWTQNEFDALVSFAYNVGNIHQLTKNGTRTKSEIASSMLLYNKSSGKVLPGLVKRREAERELFLSQVETESDVDLGYNKDFEAMKEIPISTIFTYAKKLDDLINDVIRGEWGNYPERYARLEEAGYNYADVQHHVDMRMKKNG